MSTLAAVARFVVCSLRGEEDPWALPASRVVEQAIAYGGEQVVYELAAALAALDQKVELRGEIARQPWERVRDAVGVRVTTGLPARRPRPEDIVVVPEGLQDPLAYARLSLSPARLVLLVLAPTGMFGWPFTSGWSPPDPLEVDPATLGAAEHLLGAQAMGFTVWTNMKEMKRRSDAAGVPAAWIGYGWPSVASRTPPSSPAKTVDIAYLANNRWAPLAERAARALPEDVRVDAIPETPHPELLARLGAARVLLWPSRVEGETRIAIEARIQGTVPVALASNSFASHLREEDGVVLVDHPDELALAARALVRDRERWQELSTQAARSAHRQVGWDQYVARVRDAVVALPERSGRAAWGQVGDELGDELERLTRRGADFETELARVREALARAEGQLEALQRRKSVRAALAAARFVP